MYIDTDSGTIVNGPVVYLDDAWADHLEGVSDSEIIEFALAHGTKV